MANPKHVELLKQGVRVWNEWKRSRVEATIDLSYADLSHIELTLTNPERREAEATVFVYPIGADLIHANLAGADFSGSEIMGANFRSAQLSQVNFTDAIIWNSDFTGAVVDDADFTGARFQRNSFGSNDLSRCRGLDTIYHFAPSYIGLDTLYQSGGRIPSAFLRGCGVPDDFIAYVPSHFGIKQAIQFYSCFISYSTKDEEFARRLYSRMRDEKLRVWFAPEEMKGGEKLHEQIERAIQLHDRLLIVLSENSMQSDWVITEIQRARKTEIEEDRRKLFPIAIVDFEKIKTWKCFDADTGKDLAKEVREYFIPDFSNWKNHDSFEKAFERLLRDLRAEEKV